MTEPTGPERTPDETPQAPSREDPPEATAAAANGERRASPRWAALISTIVIAALVGGLVGVGVTLGVQRLTSETSPNKASPPSEQVTITETGAVSQVVAQASPAVVTVLPSPQSSSPTSGFVVSGNGYVVTNVDAVAGAGDLSVMLAGNPKPQPARPVAEDCATGLAILQVTGAQNLHTLSLGSSATLAPGQTVVLLGGAPPYQSMVTQGLISGVGRQSSITDPADPAAPDQLDGTLQVDQQFGAAWSGGPLLNLAGQVVGVLVHGSSNFAISSSAIQQEVQSFLSSGQLVVASLGLTTQYIDPIQADQQGVAPGEHVTSVTPGGPADVAGLQVGDVITGLGSQQLSAQNPLSAVLRQDLKPSQKVTVAYQRAGATNQVQLTLGQEVPSC
ncbi:MAG: S1C family serine protease [Candidatus Dormibacteraceae bacterium]